MPLKNNMKFNRFRISLTNLPNSNFLCYEFQFIQSNDFILLLTVITSLVAFLPFFFLICHFGESVTTAFAKLNGAIYNMPWYLLAIKEQQCVGPMLLISHQAFHFKGYASLNCSHETFKNVSFLFQFKYPERPK